MKEERREIAETRRKAMPNEVGGMRRRTVGAKEQAERMKRVKLRQERRRLVKEQVLLLSLEDDDDDVNNDDGAICEIGRAHV